MQRLAFTPGADYRYSNSGYVLLGFIAEKVSGVHLGDFLTQEVFEPLGMSNTAMAGRAAPPPDVAARGYRSDRRRASSDQQHLAVAQ